MLELPNNTDKNCGDCGKSDCSTCNDTSSTGGRSKNMLRAVVGLGLGLMVVSYVVSMKSDLFRAQIVSDSFTSEETLVVGDQFTGEDLFAAASDVQTGEMALIDGVQTSEDMLFAASGVMTGEEQFALNGAATEEEMIAMEEPVIEEEDEVVVVLNEPTVSAPIFDEPVADEIVEPMADEMVAIVEEPVMDMEEPLMDELMAAPMEHELVETGASEYLVFLLVGLLIWAGSMVRSPKTATEALLVRK